jgi:FMN phosphatase YigB (HAD superfamily)
MNRYRFVFVDVAETLLTKPGLVEAIDQVLTNAGIRIDRGRIALHHRLVRETIDVPDRTSRSFYRHFNRLLLFSLGVLPTASLVDDLYDRLAALPWAPFEDVDELRGLAQPLGVISNWSARLSDDLRRHVDLPFFRVIGSEEHGVRKPAAEIFLAALDGLPGDPAEALYVGDSLRLDMEPALAMGMTAVLVDRMDVYPAYSGPRVRDLDELVRKIRDSRL